MAVHSTQNKSQQHSYTKRINDYNNSMKLKLVQKKGNYLSFLILLVGILFISGCIEQQTTVQPQEKNSFTTPKTPSPTVQPSPQVTAEMFDVKISSFTCNWTVKTNEYGTKSDCVRIISTGTARGPVGARVELPLLSWSDDKFDCGNWTHKTGALIAVGHTCVRKEGQPETTTWTVDTEGNDCPLKNYFNNNRSHSVKIYKNDELYPEKEDKKNTLCQ